MTRILSQVLAATALVSLLLSGCARNTLTSSSTEPEQTTTTRATSTSTSTVAPTQPPQATTPPGGPVRTVTEFTDFSSPTGNIGCGIDPEYVRCDIMERDWQPPPRPADCPLDYGQGIELAREGEAVFVCAGDTVGMDHSPLPYGESIQAGPIRCTSEQTGMTCTSAASGHGFMLSRGAYRIT